MTYPHHDDTQPDVTFHLRRYLHLAWLETDRHRMQTKPGSKAEADLLARQHAIEQLQQVLR